jgi:hypothetical protein
MKHPVTGEDVPDPLDRVVIYKYLNARAAEWPEADYIVSNPPFIGNARIREQLGDGYAEIVREIYDDIPATVDFVMYWWHKAANLVRSNKLKQFGLITTNSIRQMRLRCVIQAHLILKPSLRLIFAIPDHPWTDEGAAVRISMTSAALENTKELKLVSLGEVIICWSRSSQCSETKIQFSVILSWDENDWSWIPVD